MHHSYQRAENTARVQMSHLRDTEINIWAGSDGTAEKV